MSNHNRIVAHLRITNPQDVPRRYVRQYNALDAARQAAVRGGDELFLQALARSLTYVHNLGGNFVTFGPRATKRAVAKLDKLGVSVVVEFGRVAATADGVRIMTDNVNQRKYAAAVAGA